MPALWEAATGLPLAKKGHSQNEGYREHRERELQKLGQ